MSKLRNAIQNHNIPYPSICSSLVSAVGQSPRPPLDPDLPEPGLQLARGLRLPQLRRAAQQLAAEEDQRDPLIPARVLPAHMLLSEAEL